MQSVSVHRWVGISLAVTASIAAAAPPNSDTSRVPIRLADLPVGARGYVDEQPVSPSDGVVTLEEGRHALQIEKEVPGGVGIYRCSLSVSRTDRRAGDREPPTS